MMPSRIFGLEKDSCIWTASDSNPRVRESRGIQREGPQGPPAPLTESPPLSFFCSFSLNKDYFTFSSKVNVSSCLLNALVTSKVICSLFTTLSSVPSFYLFTKKHTCKTIIISKKRTPFCEVLEYSILRVTLPGLLFPPSLHRTRLSCQKC